MKTLSSLGLLLGFSVLTATYSYELTEEWNKWKSTHKKSYISEEDEWERHSVWLANQKYINEHNAEQDVFGFTLATNQFGDMTDAEFLAHHSCYEERKSTEPKKFFHASSYESYPEDMDWRNKDAVSPVQDQDQCGASYAFSAVGALEGAASLALDHLVALSEQNVVDCSVPYGNHGCNGGNIYDVYQYIINNEGLDTAKSYPYKAKQGVCTYRKNNSGASMSGIISIPTGSEKDLLAAVATVGPVSVAVDASTNAFRFYAGGVFDSHECSSSKLTHSMVITGYGEYSGKKYWLVKNSWGTSWGFNGYIMMSRDRFNQCGIASDASYPTL